MKEQLILDDDRRSNAGLRLGGATLFWILSIALAIAFWHSHQNAWYHTTLVIGIVVAAFVAGAVAVRGAQINEAIEPLVTSIRRSGNFVTFLCVFVASLVWWHYLWLNHVDSVPRIIAISLAGFIIGVLLGFLFSSYGDDEAKSIGKVRDWLLAGITGITLVNAAKLKDAVDHLAPQNEDARTVIYCVLVVYVGLGFLLMFFQRELILNVIVARARVERVQVENTQQTAVVLQRAMAVLPPSLLSGIEDADEITDESRREEAKRIRDLLYSADVNSFLNQVEQSVRSGSALPWDLISKVANVHYYRSYFEEGANKAAQARKSIEWITRALQLTPLHADLTMKLADMYAMLGDYDAGVAILERLATRPEAPTLAQQWLGYFLLFVPGREQDSIRHSDHYLSLFPDEPYTHLNKARAYAQLFAIAYRKGSDPVPDMNSCVEELTNALQLKPSLYAYIRDTLAGQGNYSFAAIENNPKYGADFKRTLESFAPRPSSAVVGAAGTHQSPTGSGAGTTPPVETVGHQDTNGRKDSDRTSNS